MKNCLLCKNIHANDNGIINPCCDCDGLCNKAIAWFRKKYTAKCIITSMMVITDRDNDRASVEEYDNIKVRIHIEYFINIHNDKPRSGVVSYIEEIPGVAKRRSMAFTGYPD